MADVESGSAPLLQVDNVVKHFSVTSRRGRTKRKVHAVDGVSLSLRAGETLGLVGESGCGKSTLARLVVRLLEPTSGRVLIDGQDIFALDDEAMRQMRRRIQIVFQDPYSSLNPRMRVGDIVREPWEVFDDAVPVSERDDRVRDLLTRVGLNPDDARRFPHQFSGGQRQRIGIARALALEPEIIVCDEPVSALDVSVQAQVLNLLEEIQETLGVAYLFISHDLSVVRHICDRVAVMYLGRIVELGDDVGIYEGTRHPYTHGLLAAVPSVTAFRGGPTADVVIEGDVPDPTDPPSGCRFRTRCWRAEQRCVDEVPQLMGPNDDQHVFACHFPLDLSDSLGFETSGDSGITNLEGRG